MEMQDYKKFLIDNIMSWQTKDQFNREELEKKSIRALEIIHDNI